MKIAVGSKNPAKVEAVREILQDYPHLKDAEVTGIEVPSGVSDQPLSLEEITTGAMNRAKAAFSDCDYSIGIEAGFMKVPNSKSGYMNMCAVAIDDGKETHLGLSSGFETPDREIMRLVIEDGFPLDKAANQTGLTHDPKIGSGEGVSGLLTRGKVTRKEYTKQALRTALIHIDELP
jgi:inosine/xanthosine triphosphatase